MIGMVEVLPWVGPSCSRNSLSILVVSSNATYIANLSKALSIVHLERSNQWKLSVHNSDNISSILGYLNKIGPMSIDFVIVCMDTTILQCIDWTREVIKQCHEDLRPGRIILINGSGLPVLEMAVPTDQITAIKREYKVQLLNGNLNLTTEAKDLARRVHIIIDIVMGLKDGLPYPVNSLT